MRLVSAYSVLCDCGSTVEWPDTVPEHNCGKCGRLLSVATWPNAPLMNLWAGEKSPSPPSARVAKVSKDARGESEHTRAEACGK